MAGITKDLLAILRCPQDRTALSEADAATIEAVNRAISAGRLRNQAGATVEKRCEGGLVRADGQLLYPIVDGLPIMLADEAIPLSQIAGK